MDLKPQELVKFEYLHAGVKTEQMNYENSPQQIKFCTWYSLKTQN